MSNTKGPMLHKNCPMTLRNKRENVIALSPRPWHSTSFVHHQLTFNCDQNDKRSCLYPNEYCKLRNQSNLKSLVYKINAILQVFFVAHHMVVFYQRKFYARAKRATPNICFRTNETFHRELMEYRKEYRALHLDGHCAVYEQS